MMPGLPGAVLTSVYYVLLVLAMPFVALRRAWVGQSLKWPRVLGLFFLMSACLLSALIITIVMH